MNRLLYILFFTLFAIPSCKENIIIDTEEGELLIGIYGSITNEEKRHTITISRSEKFYEKKDPDGILNAKVFVIERPINSTENEGDTIHYTEISKGIYETTDICMARQGYSYEMHAIFKDNGVEKEFTAKEDYSYNNFSIDSIAVLKDMFYGDKSENRNKICPYFDSKSDNESVFISKVAINGKVVTDSLNEFLSFKMQGLSKVYFNGTEMEKLLDDRYPLGLYYLDKNKKDEVLCPMDKVTLHLYKVSEDYYKYVIEVQNNRGSNPFFGSPFNVRSNIKPEGRALGFFFVASHAECSTTIGEKQDIIMQ